MENHYRAKGEIMTNDNEAGLLSQDEIEAIKNRCSVYDNGDNEPDIVNAAAADIQSLLAHIDALNAEREQAMDVLGVSKVSGLVDACRQVKHVAGIEASNSERALGVIRELRTDAMGCRSEAAQAIPEGEKQWLK